VLEEAEAAGGAATTEKPSLEDLDAAFTLADEDASGKVDEREFVRLMKLIQAGKITGLGRPGWFQKGAVEQKFKGELATAAAADAQEVALAAALAAAGIAEKAKAAAAKVAAGKAKAGAPFAASKDDADELEWRAKFAHEAGPGKTFLDQAQFVGVVKKLIVRMMMKTGSGGSVPLNKDLEAAFVVADEDNSGGVDVDEFVTMMRVVKAGGAAGLGDGGWFSASSDKTAKFKAALKQTEEADAAKKAAHMAAAFQKAAAGDLLAKDEAEAIALALSAKDAYQATKAAEKEAAKAAAKAAFVTGSGSSSILGGFERSDSSPNGSDRTGGGAEKTPEEKLRAAAAAEAAKLSSAAPKLTPKELQAKHGFESVSDMMMENGVGQFTLALHEHGVDDFSELKVRE
jgi:Ca2+-binding EF-hand superfamily protein